MRYNVKSALTALLVSIIGAPNALAVSQQDVNQSINIS